MKTLYLLRHAKASKELIYSSDFDRPLTEQGYEDAHSLGKYLSEKKIRIDVWLSSPAIRGISTALVIAETMSYNFDKIQLRKKLYESSVEEYLDCISEIEEGNSILLAGHNPTISDAVNHLSTQPIEGMKTCAFISLQFDISSWKDIYRSKGTLNLSIFPSMIKDL